MNVYHRVSIASVHPHVGSGLGLQDRAAHMIELYIVDCTSLVVVNVAQR